MPGHVIKTLAVPVRAIITGSPVLARRLLGIGADTRGKAARLRELELQKLRKEWSGMDEQKRLAAELAHRKAGRSRRFDAVMSGAVIAVFGLVLVGPYLRWVLIGVLVAWSVAAMAHAPAAEVEEQAVEGLDSDDDLYDGEDDEELVEKPAPLTAPELVAVIERMVAIRAAADGGAGNVLLSEALAALQRGRQFEGYDTREFGAAVRAAGVPPKKAVAVGSGASRRTSPGWSVAHLKETLGRAPQMPPQPAVDRTPTAA